MVNFSHVTDTEINLFQSLHKEGLGLRRIQAITGRSFDTLPRYIFKKHGGRKRKTKGRPPVIDAKTLKRMKSGYQQLLAKHKGKREVTVQMLKNHLGLTCSTRAMLNAFHKDGIYFRPLCEKPNITSDDKSARRTFAEQHLKRTAAQWCKYLHAAIDNKVFQVYTRVKHRDVAVRRTIRGVYRSRRRNLTTRNTKPSTSLKCNTGAKSVMVTCAIGAGKVLMWHVDPGRWNARAAAEMCEGPLLKALKKKYPGVKRKWRVLEDNDPSGYKSRLGEDTKAKIGITPFSLPPRSPDLNPLDYSIWAELNKRMRKTGIGLAYLQKGITARVSGEIA